MCLFCVEIYNTATVNNNNNNNMQLPASATEYKIDCKLSTFQENILFKLCEKRIKILQSSPLNFITGNIFL